MKKKKRILHFHTNGVMASLFVGPLIEFERVQGYESTLITSIYPTKFGGKPIPFDLNPQNVPFLPFAFIALCIAFARYKPDVVISHNSKSSPLPLFVAWLMRVPVRVYFNHGVPYAGYTGNFRKFLECLEAFNIFFSTNVITVSGDMKNLLVRKSKLKSVSLIGNGSACGIDLDLFNAEKYRDSSFRISHNILATEFTAVFIGRPEKRKGFEVILNLWVKYFSNSEINLVLCGPTQSDVIKILGNVPGNIICLGFAKNIPEILSKVDCLILPSFHEGLSYAALEAMASKCIVIANDIPGIRNLIKDGHSGFLVKENSIEEYFKIISAIKNRPALLQVIREEGLKTAHQFSRKSFLINYLEFIRKLIL